MMVRRMVKLGVMIITVIAFIAGPEAAIPGVPADTVISEAVENILEWDPGVAAHYIDVTTRNGIVSVSGYVDNILSRDRVGELIASIRGVRAIINRLEIRPVFRTDEQIRAAVESNLSLDPATRAFGIDVTVRNQFVTLTGSVSSRAEKTVAGTVVKGVAGVVGVRNDVAVSSVGTVSDREIRKKIAERISIGLGLYADSLDYTVKNGVVTVKGVVPTIRQYMLVRKVMGEIPGVGEVDVSDLKVLGFSSKHNATGRPLTVMNGDERIQLTLEDVFRYSPRLVPYIIEYDVDSGRVYLSGTVDNLMTKRVAQQRAASIVSVRQVINEITVRPTELREDWKLEKDVDNVLKWDPYVERHEIDVWVNNGKVYLYGTVDNEFEKAHAEEIVARIRGVAAIQNNLTRPDTPWPRRSDAAIRRGILKRISWNDRVAKKNTAVKVTDGVATVSGTIDTWKEYLSLLNCAFGGGAKGVRMDVKVKDDERYFRFSPHYYPYGYPYGTTFGFSIPF